MGGLLVIQEVMPKEVKPLKAAGDRIMTTVENRRRGRVKVPTMRKSNKQGLSYLEIGRKTQMLFPEHRLLEMLFTAVKIFILEHPHTVRNARHKFRLTGLDKTPVR